MNKLYTCSRYVNDKLICLASYKVVPSTFDLLTLSEPAKSTKCNFDTNPISESFSFPSIDKVKIQ